MKGFFNKISNSIGKLADVINGSESAEEPAKVSSEPKAPVEQPKAPAEKPEVKAETAKAEAAKTDPPKVEPTKEQLFNNAIDKRDRAIRYILDEFRAATGSNNSAMASLYLFVIVDREDYDIAEYAWADDTMKEQLRLQLDNAMLDAVGKRKLEIVFITKDALTSDAKTVIPDVLYYTFVNAPVTQKQVRAKISIIDGTGSLAKPEYLLDSKERKVYHIGRGPVSRKPGAMRPNDIVIRDADPDKELQGRNNYVSSAHADIVADNGHFYIKALRWGCRPLGGAATKLIYDGNEHEICDINMKYPLNDGYIIELGKEVMLMFNTLES
ncbi:MAG: hypothetical protein NC338_03035 [Firmicutes bacterium]|nr:hypothetical protein [Bacillota bacterium]MCM1401251.1 hypothetical protein [Bacteroides sp.]